MSMYNGRIYCRYPYNIYDHNEQKRMGFHRKSKECLTKFEAERLAKKLGCRRSSQLAYRPQSRRNTRTLQSITKQATERSVATRFT